MGKPAARLGDMTAHGGSIVVGLPTVLIGGMPAARVGDMHVCPMLNPGVPPPPHVGGPIMMGSPMVLIGGMPAARMGDMVTCAGPPDTIMLGCMTVLIGEGGSGSAAGGGAGTSAAANAQASAATAKWNNLESTTKREHWVEFQFVDKAGLPVSGVEYRFTDPGKKTIESLLSVDGKIRRDALPKGQCNAELVGIISVRWSKPKVGEGSKVTLSAKVEGIENGAKALVQVYQRDLRGPDVVVDTLHTKVKNQKVEVEWEYRYCGDQEHDDSEWRLPYYSAPQFYGEVIIGRHRARSNMVIFEDRVEIELKNEDGDPVSGEEFMLVLPTGEVRTGKLDSNGQGLEKQIPPGNCEVMFPRVKVYRDTTVEPESTEVVSPSAPASQETALAVAPANRLRLCTQDGSPLRLCQYEIQVGDDSTTGVTNEDGWTGDLGHAGSRILLKVKGFSYEVHIEQAEPRDVLYAQSMLNALGLSVGPVDGKLCPETEHALEVYQRTHGLAVTRRVDADTIQSLKGEHWCQPP
jgi:uncharacterized Zn-binding protein involved in type VI secretion